MDLDSAAPAAAASRHIARASPARAPAAVRLRWRPAAAAVALALALFQQVTAGAAWPAWAALALGATVLLAGAVPLDRTRTRLLVLAALAAGSALLGGARAAACLSLATLALADALAPAAGRPAPSARARERLTPVAAGLAAALWLGDGAQAATASLLVATGAAAALLGLDAAVAAAMRACREAGLQVDDPGAMAAAAAVDAVLAAAPEPSADGHLRLLRILGGAAARRLSGPAAAALLADAPGALAAAVRRALAEAGCTTAAPAADVAEPVSGVRRGRVAGTVVWLGPPRALARHGLALAPEIARTAAPERHAGCLLLGVAWQGRCRGLLVLRGRSGQGRAGVAALRGLGIEVRCAADEPVPLHQQRAPHREVVMAELLARNRRVAVLSHGPDAAEAGAHLIVRLGTASPPPGQAAGNPPCVRLAGGSLGELAHLIRRARRLRRRLVALAAPVAAAVLAALLAVAAGRLSLADGGRVAALLPAWAWLAGAGLGSRRTTSS